MRSTRTAALVVAAVLGLSAAGCASAGKPRDGGSAGGGPSPATGPHSEAPPAPPPQSAIAQQCGPPEGPASWSRSGPPTACGSRLSRPAAAIAGSCWCPNSAAAASAAGGLTPRSWPGADTTCWRSTTGAPAPAAARPAGRRESDVRHPRRRGPAPARRGGQGRIAGRVTGRFGGADLGCAAAGLRRPAWRRCRPTNSRSRSRPRRTRRPRSPLSRGCASRCCSRSQARTRT